MSFDWRKRVRPLGLGFLLFCGADLVGADPPAQAQFFFEPFFRGGRYDLPPEEAPRYASRRAVARILARAGYELVGPLGRRGDQIVATGVSRRDGATRFFIDPYEGAILHAMRLEAPMATGRDWGAPAAPDAGQTSVVGEPRRDAPRRAARVAPPDPGASAVAGKPLDLTKPAEPGEPRQAPSARPGPERPAPAQEAAKPAPAPADPAAAPTGPPEPKAARAASPSRGAGSSRAIVPPRPAEGASTAPPPAQPGATVALPKANQ